MTEQANRAELVRAGRGGDVAALRELLHASDDDLVTYAIGQIRKHGVTELLPELRAALGSTNSDVRAAAALAFTKFPEPELHDDFVRLLEDSSEEVRRLALRGLSRSDDGAAIEIASKWYANDSSFLVKHESVDALASIGSVRSAETLQLLLAKETSWRWRRVLRRGIRRQRKTSSLS